MSSLLSDLQKSQISAILDSVPDTFKRAITYFETPTETLIFDSINHNAFFEDANNNAVVQLIHTSGTFQATIAHGKKQEFSNLKLLDKNGDTSNNMLLKEGECKISVALADKSVIDRASRLIIDGFTYQKSSDVRPRGIFSINYYDYYLKRIT